MERLFIFVVPVCGQNIYFHDSLFYLINQSMLLGDASGPLADSVSGERLGFTGACFGVLLKLLQ